MPPACGGAKDIRLRGSEGPPRLHSSNLGWDGECCNDNDGHVKTRVAKPIPGRGHPWMERVVEVGARNREQGLLPAPSSLTDHSRSTGAGQR